MSEKPSEREIRQQGAHPNMRPESPIGLDNVHRIHKTKGRRALMSGPGFFDDQEEFQAKQDTTRDVSIPIEESTFIHPNSELEPRKLKFKAGTRLYKVKPDSEGKPLIPRNPVEENDLFDRQLTVATYLDIPAEYLEIGKRGGTITKKVGQSAYGAFTVVLVPVRKRSGEIVLEKRLASYLTRSSRKQL